MYPIAAALTKVCPGPAKPVTDAMHKHNSRQLQLTTSYVYSSLAASAFANMSEMGLGRYLFQVSHAVFIMAH
jgi:hypothetical protein